MRKNTLLYWFIVVAIAEGISFLVLLGIAMPMKYLMGQPLPVTITGYIHGFLFIAFIALAWRVKERYNKNFGWFIWAFIASLLPFGTFVLHRRLEKQGIRA